MAEVVHQVLAEAASDAPQREAVRHRGTPWTYGQLAAAAEGVARALVAAGIRKGDRVGYLAPKRREAVAAFYGTLRAGGVWVPIDPNAPRPWVERVAADCAISALVTTADRASMLADGAAAAARLTLLLPGSDGGQPAVDHLTWEDAMASSTEESPPAIGPDDMAAIFYTSGSSGPPKGVIHSHRSLLRSATWFATIADMVAEDRIPLLPPLHFHMSLYGLISSVMARSTSILVSLESGFRGTDLIRLVRDERVTIWRSVTHPFQVLLGAAPDPDSLASLRLVTLGGGAWRPADVEQMRAVAPRARLRQTYGTTESGTICTHVIEGPIEPGRRVPVGRPVEHARAVHLRHDGTIADVDEEGEMVVRSPTMMLGYWGDRAKTDAVLVPDPSGREPTLRWYRTGDIVRLRPDGVYEFVGRRDDMVKSRGYRVELGQVEVALASHPAVRESAAGALPHVEWGTAIVAFATLSRDATASELRRHVAERLPMYMVPQRIHVVPLMPRTSTGKVDRRRLLADIAEDGPAGA